MTGKSSPKSHTVDVSEGEFVFQENDLGTEMYIVHEGQVEILESIGAEMKRLAVMEKGDFFGEMSLLDDLPRNASARALSDSRLLRINGSMFVQMLRKEPEIAIRIMRKFSRRLREADRMLKQTISGLDGTSVGISSESQAPERRHGKECLRDEKSGMTFYLLEGEETTVGRKDPVTGIYPGIDLTPVDSQRSTSRRHAKLYRKGGKFYVAEGIGTMNGTFVNSTRLETGVPMEIEDGNEVRFGVVGLTFHLS
ncbi:MAG: cyclic nucleotide-binding domain-containing protein [Deltaproteobacteria bacterium]|nr:cyclic nucleotide-binding domain-containing protein [Deltaproteobacteria bacterium]